MKGQLPRVPAEASHLAILNSDLLTASVASTVESLAMFSERVSLFALQYRAALGRVRALGRPATVCTIYNGNFPADERELIRIALMMFNDVILRVAFELRFDVLDLRTVCRDAADYANPIEPSGEGGRKVAQAIVHALGIAGAAVPQSRVFGG